MKFASFSVDTITCFIDERLLQQKAFSEKTKDFRFLRIRSRGGNLAIRPTILPGSYVRPAHKRKREHTWCSRFDFGLWKSGYLYGTGLSGGLSRLVRQSTGFIPGSDYFHLVFEEKLFLFQDVFFEKFFFTRMR